MFLSAETLPCPSCPPASGTRLSSTIEVGLFLQSAGFPIPPYRLFTLRQRTPPHPLSNLHSYRLMKERREVGWSGVEWSVVGIGITKLCLSHSSHAQHGPRQLNRVRPPRTSTCWGKNKELFFKALFRYAQIYSALPQVDISTLYTCAYLWVHKATDSESRVLYSEFHSPVL